MKNNGNVVIDEEEREVDAPAESEELDVVPGVQPGSLVDLASQLERGEQIIRARAQILATARKAAVQATHPEDWLLFRDKQGREVGYLQDCGCDRVKDIFGIRIFNVSTPTKVMLSDREFMYVQTGDGESRLTQQTVEGIEGGRASTDDFIQTQKPPLTGAKLELAVRKATRANLDGNIARELSGLKSVPLEEINDAFKGTAKERSRFREGRGYGAQGERSHAGEKAPEAQEAPPCPECGAKMVYRSGTSKNGKPYAFWGCQNYQKTGCQGSIDAEKWDKQRQPKREVNGSSSRKEPEPEESPSGEFSPPDNPSDNPNRYITDKEWEEVLLLAGNRGIPTRRNKGEESELMKMLFKSYGVHKGSEMTLENFEDFKRVVTE